MVELDLLYERFPLKNEQFDVPYSTFEPTKRTSSVSNINTIPGSETLCYDCRVLPMYKLDCVLTHINQAVEKVKKETGVEITYEVKQRVDAPQETSVNAPIVQQLVSAIEKKLGFTPKTYGVGGGTVAAYFRQKGYNAALWTTLDGTMHGPNEYSSIENTKKDAVKLAKKLNAKLIITASNPLSDYTHVENGKLIAILDYSLASAILSSEEDFIYYVMEANK